MILRFGQPKNQRLYDSRQCRSAILRSDGGARGPPAAGARASALRPAGFQVTPVCHTGLNTTSRVPGRALGEVRGGGTDGGDGGTSSRGGAPRQPAALWPPRGRRLPSPAHRTPFRARAATLRHECARDVAVAHARGSESAAWRLRRRYCAQGRAEEHARCRSAWG